CVSLRVETADGRKRCTANLGAPSSAHHHVWPIFRRAYCRGPARHDANVFRPLLRGLLLGIPNQGQIERSACAPYSRASAYVKTSAHRDVEATLVAALLAEAARKPGDHKGRPHRC